MHSFLLLYNCLRINCIIAIYARINGYIQRHCAYVHVWLCVSSARNSCKTLRYFSEVKIYKICRFENLLGINFEIIEIMIFYEKERGRKQIYCKAFILIHNAKFKNELMDLCKEIKQRSIDNSYFMIFYILLQESLFLLIKKKILCLINQLYPCIMIIK